ncbi:MAG TPA: Asp-tRNA(Asn)/Glu-tRNA(Gln) amidotransferase subunit GatB [Candidatus Binataceae bacterium]|nr:Asp-tRNA(Asn)/Glu-tRNA(Gln) amidotransferase subunit GatB [Candidatus Binataceae bacterium]
MSAHEEKYEAVIGLEVHAQLLTKSKIFCGCSTEFGASPNTHVCPVCSGMPGVLPVFNRHVLELAIRAGLAAHCAIAPRSIFDRKNYFYPDLPKGYQISQYETPLCLGGYIELPNENDDGAPTRIRLVRIHLEEDAGKNIHAPDSSLVDFNRSGVPLMEIVSEPDIRTPEQAGAYLRELRSMLRYLEVCNGNMEEGNFRCDANISVRLRGSSKLGVKTEVKNMNSFRNVEHAIAYEITRQAEALEAGERIAQETRLWDPERGVTRSMRSKEHAHDYRYFPEPDLAPLIAPPDLVEQIRIEMPQLPAARRARYTAEMGLTPYEANVLTQEREISDYFEAVLPGLNNKKAAANWVMSEVLRAVNESGRTLAEAAPAPGEVGALLKMVETAAISLNAAKTAFAAMCKSGKSAQTTVTELGLLQVSDEAAIAAACDKLIAAEPDKVAEYRGGRDKLFGFFVGQVMKAMGGKANPKIINEVLRRKLAAS